MRNVGRRGLTKRGSRYRGSSGDMTRMMRQDLIKELGGKCVKCGFCDWRALQVDHINGVLPGQERVFATYQLLRDVIYCKKMNIERYQLLCANCNWIKKHENNETGYSYKRSPVNHDNGSGVSLSDINSNVERLT